jgi:hypothetical protein
MIWAFLVFVCVGREQTTQMATRKTLVAKPQLMPRNKAMPRRAAAT